MVPAVFTYTALMQVLATRGQFVAGFALLAWAEISGLLFHSDEGQYRIFRTLLEACRTDGDSEGSA